MTPRGENDGAEYPDGLPGLDLRWPGYNDRLCAEGSFLCDILLRTLLACGERCRTLLGRAGQGFGRGFLHVRDDFRVAGCEHRDDGIAHHPSHEARRLAGNTLRGLLFRPALGPDPPLALAAFAAAGLAGADPMRTAAIGFRLSIAKLLVPFTFVYTPALLFIDFDPVSFAIGFAGGVLSIVFLSAGFTGHFAGRLGGMARTVLLPAGFCLIFGSPVLLAIAGGAGVIVLAWNFAAASARHAEGRP